ncbi:MAG: hypothetical protein B5M56_05700 [Desulfococcus sp. 4484_241]|nr:MAG: hypothetical protein B5M56_05700 [Desulfococcus sp. 4484_241]
MKHAWKVCAIVFVCLCLAGTGAWAADPAQVAIGKGMAVVTALDGEASLVGRNMHTVRKLAVGQSLSAGAMIKVGDRSRLEIKLPDGSFLRFDAASVFELKELSVDSKNRTRNISVDMVMGKIWATVSRLFSGKSRFDVSIKTTTAGVRGTVFRVNVNSDESALIKVYDGAVEVKGHAVATSHDRNGPLVPGRVSQPHPVAGPTPVQGPHPVSMEEWVYTLKAMQQIMIRPDGTATKPFSFSFLEDLNNWVEWNRARDKALGRSIPDVGTPQGDGGVPAPGQPEKGGQSTVL